MEIKVKILRYNPETDKRPHYQTYRVEAEPTDRVLDLLEKIKGYQDGSLAFRRSCAHGICGSDAMRILQDSGQRFTQRDDNGGTALGVAADQRLNRGYGSLL